MTPKSQNSATYGISQVAAFFGGVFFWPCDIGLACGDGKTPRLTITTLRVGTRGHNTKNTKNIKSPYHHFLVWWIADVWRIGKGRDHGQDVPLG